MLFTYCRKILNFSQLFNVVLSSFTCVQLLSTLELLFFVVKVLGKYILPIPQKSTHQIVKINKSEIKFSNKRDHQRKFPWEYGYKSNKRWALRKVAERCFLLFGYFFLYYILQFLATVLYHVMQGNIHLISHMRVLFFELSCVDVFFLLHHVSHHKAIMLENISSHKAFTSQQYNLSWSVWQSALAESQPRSMYAQNVHIVSKHNFKSAGEYSINHLFEQTADENLAKYGKDKMTLEVCFGIRKGKGFNKWASHLLYLYTTFSISTQ